MADDDVKNNDSPIPSERFTPEPDADPATPDEDGGEDQGQQIPLMVNGQYIKDFSFEAPNAPEIYQVLQNTQPAIQVDIDVQGENKGENVFEVMLKVRAEAKANEELAYLIELEYAGLFTVNVEAELLGPVLLIECPLILFPYLRRIISDTTGDGGFAPLMLAPIDFASLYQQRMSEAQAAQQDTQQDTEQDTEQAEGGPSVAPPEDTA